MVFNAKEFSNDDERPEEEILNFTKPVEHRGWRGRVSIHYKTKPHKFGVFVLLPVFCLTKMLSPEEERRQILNSGAFAVGGKLMSSQAMLMVWDLSLPRNYFVAPDDFLILVLIFRYTLKT